MSDDDISAKLERLERRVKRERSSREQAERIAEDGMRRLFLANQELDARVAERTAELDSERRAAARSAGERAEFLRLLSRETRSPLNGVIGMMEVLEQNAETDQQRAWLADGLDAAGLLDSIMTRLLLFLELEGEHPAEMAPFSPGDVLTQVSTRWKHEALQAGLLLATDNQCPVEVKAMGYVADVNAVLDELVSNSIRHADAGLLQVTAECGSPSAIDSVVLSVSDPGPGIADAAPLLDPEFQDWKNSGIRGMGYSLIQRLAERTQADVEIESSSGDQTTVRLTLPLASL